MDPNPKQQAVERIKDATNVLVTVSKNPTVDQLSACIGFTLLLNKLGKHGTAVFSGKVPSTLEFLQPEKTLEQTTDSLRDFIIALDKSKADKLRYKVEDDVVRIFITPYRTSITDKDLVFSQGDYNVDVIVALGVNNKEDLDEAIISHGRILHDAVVISVTNGAAPSDVGGINWHDSAASSLSEMLVSVSESFQSGLLDGQMATAFLTGIVAETERFSNDKTTPKVMTMSAQLMAAGANQQLIATKLAPPPPPPVLAPMPIVKAPDQGVGSEQPSEDKPKVDGEIDILHEEIKPDVPKEHYDENEIHIDDQGNLKLQEELRAAEEEARKKEVDAKAATEAEKSTEVPQNTVPTQPAVGVPDQPITATIEPQPNISEPTPTTESVVDSPVPAPSTTPDAHRIIQPLQHDKFDPMAALQSLEPSLQLPSVADPKATPSVPPAPVPDSLTQLEQAVESPHVTNETPVSVEEARQAVSLAGLDSVPPPQAAQSVGAQIVDLCTLSPAEQPAVPPTMSGVGDVLQQTATPPAEPQVIDPMAPPPVPPPMMPQYYNQAPSAHTYLTPPAGQQPGQQDENSAQL